LLCKIALQTGYHSAGDKFYSLFKRASVEYTVYRVKWGPFGQCRKLMADLANGGPDDEPAAKRTRLESVIPIPAPARKKEAAKGQSTPPPPPRPCPPPLWLSGQLPPAQRGRGASSQNSSSYRGGGPAGGSPRGGYRGASGGGAGRGNRGAPRGGQRGRWRRW
jgi:hypothetical protein